MNIPNDCVNIFLNYVIVPSGRALRSAKDGVVYYYQETHMWLNRKVERLSTNHIQNDVYRDILLSFWRILPEIIVVASVLLNGNNQVCNIAANFWCLYLVTSFNPILEWIGSGDWTLETLQNAITNSGLQSIEKCMKLIPAIGCCFSVIAGSFLGFATMTFDSSFFLRGIIYGITALVFFSSGEGSFPIPDRFDPTVSGVTVEYF